MPGADDIALYADAFDVASLDGFDLTIAFDRVRTRYRKPRLRPPIADVYRRAVDMARAFPREKGANLYAFVPGDFVFGDLFEALACDCGMRMDALTISTLSLSENNVDSLRNLLQSGNCKKLDLIVSHYFYSHECNRLIPYLLDELDHQNLFQLSVAGCHAKIALIQEHDKGLRFTVHGSANLRSSSNIEQMQVIEDARLFAFNRAFLHNIIQQYKLIDKRYRKGLRGEMAWQAGLSNLPDITD